MLINFRLTPPGKGTTWEAAGKLFLCRKFTSVAKAAKQSKVFTAALKRCATPKPQSKEFSQALESCCKRQQELQLAGEVYSRIASK